MAFVSFQFIIFISMVICIYFAVPSKYRWFVLLISSYIFILINSEWLVLVLFAETAVTYGAGRLIDRLFEKEKSVLSQNAESFSKAEKKEFQAGEKK